MIGKTVSHYNITDRLGGGGMGVVYKAEDIKLKRPVALKFLPLEMTQEQEAIERFIFEAQAASSLDHSNICTVHEIEETEEGQLFIVMSYYQGETLKKIISRGMMKIEKALDYACQIAQGLISAHEHKIIHRDIKPANIIITNNDIVKIVDFGLAKLYGSATAITKIGTTLGTAAYMSPEQAIGEEVDHRTDIWALGVVIYEMVTGKLPFRGEYDSAIIYSILNEDPQPLNSLRSEVPAELNRIVLKALEKDPSERYQHIDDMLTDLKKLLKEQKSGPKTAVILGEKKKNSTKRSRKSILATTLLLVTVVVIAFTVRIWMANSRTASEPVPIAVVSFINQTGDQNYDYLQEAIPNLLITNLEQSKSFRVATWERLNDLLRLSGKMNVKLINSELGIDLCKRDGIDVIVVGSYVKAGNTFVTDVKVLDVDTKQILLSASSRGKGIASILENQIDELSREIARGVGSYDKQSGQVRTRIIETATSSMDAYNYYLRGRSDLEKFYFDDARKFLENAVSIDSTFASAYLYLSWVYESLADKDKTTKAIEKAMLYSGKANEKDRLFIKACYAGIVERNNEKRYNLLNQIIRSYPKEKRTYFELAVYYRSLQKYDKAIKEIDKVLKLDPGYGAALNEMAYNHSLMGNYDKAMKIFERYAYSNPGDANPFDSMGDLYWMTGKPEKAIEKYRKALEVRTDFYPSAWKIGHCYAVKENYYEARKWIEKAYNLAPSTGTKNQMKLYWGFLEYMVGRVNKAVSILKTGENEDAINAMILKAYIYYDCNRFSEGRKTMAEYVKYAENKRSKNKHIYETDYQFYDALVGIKEGKAEDARKGLSKIQEALPAMSPEAREYRLFEASLLSGELSLNDRKFQEAELHFNRAYIRMPETLSSPDMVVFNSMPFMKDGLARIFLLKNDTDKAIAVYEKLTHFDPDSKGKNLINPKYYYKLAKLYEMKGQKTKAQKYYERFLSYWKDADKNLPEYKEAIRKTGKARTGINTPLAFLFEK